MLGRIVILIIGCFFGCLNLYAQPLTQTIKGTILDTDTQTPLIGATVFIPSLEVGTTTDIDGQFRLENIPLGRYDIVASYLGYLSSTKSNVIVRSGKEVILTINLTESVNELKEVVVKASKNKSESLNQLATISSRQFTLDEARRYAGSRGEPSRMAQNYAGVSGSSDSRNDIIIRGNSPLGLLWRFEGLDIPNPNHFALAGSAGGSTSILNTNVLSNSDFLTGAFPAGYGNATSGVFDIRMRNGNSDTREYMFSAGVLGVEAMLEGGFSEKSNSSYLVNYRYSTTQILTDIVNIDIGFSGKPTYQDAAFKVKLPTKKAGIFTLFGLGGWSKYVVNAAERDSSNFDIQFTDNANYDFTATMGVVGVSHKFILKKNAYWNTTIGLTGRTEDSLVDSVSTADANIVLPFQRNINRFWNWQVHSFLNKKFSPKFLTRLGIIYNRQSFNIDERIRNSQTSDLVPFREGEGTAGLLQAYSAWQLRAKDNSSFNFGLHYQYFDLNKTQSLEWRFGAKIPVSDYRPKTFLTVGAGLHGQIQLLPLYFVNTVTPTGIEQTNLNLDFTKSRHLIIGLDHNFSSNLRLKTEAYLQDLTQGTV